MQDTTPPTPAAQGRVVYFNPKGMAVEVPAEMCERILTWGDTVTFPEPCNCGQGGLVKYCITSGPSYYCNGVCK